MPARSKIDGMTDPLKGNEKRHGIIVAAKDQYGESRARNQTTRVRSCDHNGLRQLAIQESKYAHPVAEILLRKLESASIDDSDEAADRRVRMNSYVRYRLEDCSRLEGRYLVYPHQVRPTGHYISVLSPLGASLIGALEGELVSFRNVFGTKRQALVLESTTGSHLG